MAVVGFRSSIVAMFLNSKFYSLFSAFSNSISIVLHSVRNVSGNKRMSLDSIVSACLVNGKNLRIQISLASLCDKGFVNEFRYEGQGNFPKAILQRSQPTDSAVDNFMDAS